MSSFSNVSPLSTSVAPPSPLPDVLLTDVDDGGATPGQTLVWNGSRWVPGAVSAGIGGTVGTTPNAVAVADGVGGSTLKATPVLIDPATGNVTGVGSLTCTAFAIDQTTYSGRTLNRIFADGTNESIILTPSGTGYFSTQTPDGTNTGGNQRGNNSWDFSQCTAAAYCATGTRAIAFGKNARASGQDSFCWSTWDGGGTASGVGSLALGYNVSATNQLTVAIGTAVTASGSGAIAIGTGCASTASYSLATGVNGSAYLEGQHAHGGVAFAAAGDSQHSLVVARRATSDATPANIVLAEGSGRIVVPVNTSGIADIVLVGRTNTAGAGWATARRQVSWWRGTTAASMTISAVDTIGTDRGSNAGAWPAGWAVAITADTTNGAIDIQVTGAAATNIRWTTGIRWQEVTFA